MRDIVERILNDYVKAKDERFAGHPLGLFFRNTIPNYLYNTGLVDRKNYLITGSVGQGNWATVPWVCIFDRSITTSATKGVYIAYLLAKDGKTLYLTFNQGCTDIRKTYGKSEAIRIMKKKAVDIVGRINSRGFASDDKINLGSDLADLAELYQKGTVFYKAYKWGSVPNTEVLLDDLKKMVEIYKDYKQSSGQDNSLWWPSPEEYPIQLTKEDWKKYIIEIELPNHPAPMKMLKGMMELGGEASCKLLSETYGRHPSAYVGWSTHLGKRAKEYFNLPTLMEHKKDFSRFRFWGKMVRRTNRITTFIVSVLNYLLH